MTETIGKAVVTNISALAAKYGDQLEVIRTAIDALIASDAARGVTTQLIALDDPASMEAIAGSPVTDPSDTHQTKAAIDAVFAAHDPSYLMILGAPDVVPQQPMANPVFSEDGDPDELAFGDLPYACDAPDGADPSAFIGPTRVVGRLPDVTGGSDPAYLVGLLGNAGSWEPRAKGEYLQHLGISAKEWSGSTTLSLQNLFGSSAELRPSPVEGPGWAPELLARRTHFINCHGAEYDSHFYGQEGGSYPVAHDSALVAGQVTPGTIVAAECCYGAQLFDPNLVGGSIGLCTTYLSSGAFGFFGSSTIAYGPAEGNGAADLLCQYFLRSVWQGASLGRAVLEARQAFVQGATLLDPVDLKTLAQFDLMGDPSIHPVLPDTADEAVAVDDRQESLAPTALKLVKGRTGRRANLAAIGRGLAGSTTVSRSRIRVVDEGSKMDQILAASGRRGPRRRRLLSFGVAGPESVQKGPIPPPPSAVHVVAGREDHGPGSAVQVVALVAKEVGERIVSFRRLYGK